MSCASTSQGEQERITLGEKGKKGKRVFDVKTNYPFIFSFRISACTGVPRVFKIGRPALPSRKALVADSRIKHKVVGN